MRILIIAIFLLFQFWNNAQYSYSNTYFVSNNGSDDALGSINAPLKSIQMAVNKSKPGDLIIIRGGVYRETVTIAGINKTNISLSAFSNERPLLKGSEVITKWSPAGQYWKKYLSVQPQQVMVNGDHPLQQIGYPNKNYVNDRKVEKYKFPTGAGLGDIKSGRFYWKNDTLYIWPLNNVNPNSETIEVSQREHILTILADGVHLKGLFFRYSNVNTFTEQGAAVSLGPNSVIEDCDVQWGDFVGIAMASGSKAYHCNASNNGAVGIAANVCNNFLVSGCKANHNNYRNFYAQWHAGGLKATNASWGTIEKSEFAFNNGSAIWLDYCFQQDKYRAGGEKPFYISSNYIHDNSKTSNKNPAIALEMSEDVTVRNNILLRNEYRGIYLSASWDCNVLNNTVAYTKGHFAIDLAGMSRTGESRAKLANNRIFGNIISNNDTDVDLEILPDNGTNITNNFSDNNIIHRDNGKIILESGSTYNNLADWKNATRFDHSSTSRKLSATDTLQRQ